MADDLKGKKIAFLATAMVESAADYDGLVLPGGVGNPDALRMDENAVEFVHEFFEQGKPVGAICHAPWLLIEAGVERDRTLTSWPSLTTDLRNAGANRVDEEFAEGRHEARASKTGAATS